MPLTFPLAETARAALDAPASARTLGEAREKAGGAVSLVSDWLRPSAAEREALQPLIDAGVAAGFVQVYEDNQGQPVLAVTYWKQGPARASPPPRAPAAAPPPAPPSDTVDDLYFEKAPASRRVRRLHGRRAADPNQLDLFSGPEPHGFEGADSVDPEAAIVEEGAASPAFGLGASVQSDIPPPSAPKRARRARKNKSSD